MKFKTMFSTALISCALLVGCSEDSPTSSNDGKDSSSTQQEVTYTDLSADSVKSMLSSFTKIFDVSPYYAKGHLPYAVDAGGVSGLEGMATALDKGGKYLVYCHADAPSIAGAEALVEAGMKNVYRLKGNYPAWDAISSVDITAEEAKKRIDAGEFEGIYDVSPHYAEGHLPGATNAYGEKLDMLIKNGDKSKEYLVYCHADEPSMAGAQKMEDAGFTKVYRLEGNYGAWTKAGYTTEKESPNTEPTYTDLSADSVKSMLSSFTKIFDVSPYYAKGHLPYAVDAGGVSGLEAMAASLDKDGKYLVYCHGDAPSIAGAKALVAAGIKNVYRLKGNYPAWDGVAFVDITAEEAKKRIDAGEFEGIYDVSPYYDKGHLPGATNAYGDKLDMLIANGAKDKEYLVYCHADAPSMTGAQKMEDAGFTKVYRLEGNYGAWTKAGYMVE